MDDPDLPTWLSASALADPVGRQLGHPATIGRWSALRLAGGSSDALGVWRLTGDARVGGSAHPWALVLKGVPAPPPEARPDGMAWPRREPDLYEAGLLTSLPGGIAAPACFGAITRPDGSVWMWLEDLSATTPAQWSVERLATLARQLGRFNGAWLDGRPLPSHPSLSQSWIRQRVEAAGPFVDQLGDPGGHPAVNAFFPPPVAAAYRRLWSDRERHLATLARLPQTFCHLDAFPRNTFVRPGRGGAQETVLIDWACAGIAALGEELASLVVASVIFMEVPFADARRLEAAALEGYIDGLRDVGWRGQPEAVRAGYRTAAMLRYGVGAVRLWIPLLTTDVLRKRPPIIDRPPDEVMAAVSGVQRWMAALVTET